MSAGVTATTQARELKRGIEGRRTMQPSRVPEPAITSAKTRVHDAKEGEEE